MYFLLCAFVAVLADFAFYGAFWGPPLGFVLWAVAYTPSDIWARDDLDGNHIAINVNGSGTSIATTAANSLLPFFGGVRLNDGVLPNVNVFFAWIDYDGIADVLDVRLSLTPVRPAAPLLSQGGLGLAGILGGTSAFVGFTSGTGAAGGDHDILSWRLDIGNLPSMSRVCVSQEVAPAGADDFTFLGVADVFNRSLDPAASVYAYSFPINVSYNGFPPPALSNVSQLFVVDTNDGAGSSLFFLHDQPFDPGGGNNMTEFNLSGDGRTLSGRARDSTRGARLRRKRRGRRRARNTRSIPLFNRPC